MSVPTDDSERMKRHINQINIMTDLFETIETLPLCIQNVLSNFENEGYDYETCAKYLAILEAKGYTFEVGLDGVPFNLTEKWKLFKF